MACLFSAKTIILSVALVVFQTFPVKSMGIIVSTNFKVAFKNVSFKGFKERKFGAKSIVDCLTNCFQDGCCGVAYNKETKLCVLYQQNITVPLPVNDSIGNFGFYKVDLKWNGENDGVNICPDDGHMIQRVVMGPRSWFVACSDGWIIIQRRWQGRVNFNQRWDEYRDGFGDDREFWIGNERLHIFTTNALYRLRFELWLSRSPRRKLYISYGHFNISDEADGYRMFLEDYERHESNGRDAFLHPFCGGSPKTMHGQQFSTIDVDKDTYRKSCARRFGGGWWFNRCFCAFLNGPLPCQRGFRYKPRGRRKGSFWRGATYPIIRTEIKMRLV